MEIKKVILVLTSVHFDVEMVNSLKNTVNEEFKGYGIVALDENSLGGKRNSDMRYGAKRVLMQKLPFVYRAYKRTSEELSKKNLIKNKRSFKVGERNTGKRVTNAILRFAPEIVLCCTPDMLRMAVIAKKRRKLTNVKVIGLMPTFTMKYAFYNTGADGYIVDNIDTKNELTSKGIASSCVRALGLPIAESPVTAEQAAAERVALGLSTSPTVYLYGGRYGCVKMFDVLKMLLDQGDFINVIADCGCNRELYNKSVKAVADSKALNVKVYTNTEEGNTLLAVSDIVITCYDASLIYKALGLSRPVIVYEPMSEHEEKDFEYLGGKKLACYSKTLNDVIIDLYRVIQTDYGRSLSARAGVRAGRNSLYNICSYLTLSAIVKK